jgi:hypothetical protein
MRKIIKLTILIITYYIGLRNALAPVNFKLGARENFFITGVKNAGMERANGQSYTSQENIGNVCLLH